LDREGNNKLVLYNDGFVIWFYSESNVKNSTVLTDRYDQNQLLAKGSDGLAGNPKQICTCGGTKFECKKDQRCDCVSNVCEN